HRRACSPRLLVRSRRLDRCGDRAVRIDLAYAAAAGPRAGRRSHLVRRRADDAARGRRTLGRATAPFTAWRRPPRTRRIARQGGAAASGGDLIARRLGGSATRRLGGSAARRLAQRARTWGDADGHGGPRKAAD